MRGWWVVLRGCGMRCGEEAGGVGTGVGVGVGVGVKVGMRARKLEMEIGERVWVCLGWDRRG